MFKQQRILSLAYLCLILAVLLGGCGGISLPPASSAAIELIDSMDREVSLKEAPQKMVVLTPSSVEILFALGQQHRLLAVGEYCNYPQETQQLTKLPTGSGINVEQIIALQPDCVVIDTMGMQQQVVEQLSNAGIALLVVQASDIASTYDNILLLGAATDCIVAAEEIVADMQAVFAEVREQTKQMPPVSVYLEIMPLPTPWSCGEGTFQDELLSAVGAQNIFGDISGWQQVSEEQIIERNPAVIITTVPGYEGYEDPLGEISERQNWQQIRAIQEGRVYAFDPDIISRPGPRLAVAARELFALIHDITP